VNSRSRVRGSHVVRFEQFLPRPRAEVFAFFAAADNLERITPPELGFRIRTPLPIAMGPGTLIEYRLSLFGVPFTWQTRITAWEPPHTFTDEQLKGPYREWVHTHSFMEAAGGTIVHDEVRYRLPLFPAGELAWPAVRLQIRRIFGYRRRRLAELFGADQLP
jgi:ligand-binding SRPBCC domain-containing protein